MIYLAAKLGLGSGTPMFAGEFATLTEALNVEVVDVTTLGGDVRIRAIPITKDPQR